MNILEILALGRTLGSWAKRHKPTGLDYRLVHVFSSTRKLHWWLRYAAAAMKLGKGVIILFLRLEQEARESPSY